MKENEKEKRLEIAKKFAEKALQKYKDLIKAIVVMGSVARGEFKPKSDIDVFVIIDDTQKEFSQEELESIDRELEKVVDEIPEAFLIEKEEKIPLLSIQPCYTLTEFWDYARIGHPIIYNFIKEGIAIYDTGFFTPIKKLLEMGKITATREAIENYMENAPKRLIRAKTVKLLMLAEDCYYAMLNSTQAVLMFLGLEPPVPSKAYTEVKKHLVEPGILEEKYAEWLKEIIEIRKRIEHKELLEVSGAFVDEWIKRAEEFVNKMFTLLNALEVRKVEKILERTHEVLQKTVITAIKTLKKEKIDESTISANVEKMKESVEKEFGSDLKTIFKKEFVDKGLIDSYYLNIWNRIEELRNYAERKEFDKIPFKEVYELRENVRRLIRDFAKVLREEEKDEAN
jgi:predicted nucleotidyltransferase/uncharacterized protein (UPF0332 family)